MDMLDVIKNRRSVRSFKKTPIEQQKLDAVLKAAEWAPSAGNAQARDLILVSDPGTKEKLASAALGQGFVSEAPIVLVVCANRGRSAKRYGQRGRDLYSVQDATAAVENMLLAVHSMGLGACWVGAFDEDAVKDLLSIPEDVSPIAIVPIGYPAEEPHAPSRKLPLHDGKW
jgi:nitroreductase